jgi:hypothetical protein
MYQLFTALLVAGFSVLALRPWSLYQYPIVRLALPFAAAILWGLAVAPDAAPLTDLGIRIIPVTILAPLFTWLYFRKRLTDARSSL